MPGVKSLLSETDRLMKTIGEIKVDSAFDACTSIYNSCRFNHGISNFKSKDCDCIPAAFIDKSEAFAINPLDCIRK